MITGVTSLHGQAENGLQQSGHVLWVERRSSYRAVVVLTARPSGGKVTDAHLATATFVVLHWAATELPSRHRPLAKRLTCAISSVGNGDRQQEILLAGSKMSPEAQVSEATYRRAHDVFWVGK